MTETETKEDFARRFTQAVMPSEENSFKSYFHRELWTPDQGAALVAGLDPETYRKGHAIEFEPKEYAKRDAHATKVLTHFLDDAEKGIWRKKDFKIAENEIYVSTWKFIKWLSERDIKMHERFFNQLLLTQMELYFEFTPTNIALRTASRRSRAYHEAYYLKKAEQLMETLREVLSPTEVYDHPHMQDVLRYIRELGGHYTKRTIVTSWLPKLIDSPIGRPQKI
jgi:hypothetical protein